ncbi:MAG: type IX secretion system outer membrane channel protein PorV [Proteiniphilum sp.]|uniref:type IX secretion system outer membrane channel protein PorV n=1 Tax=Proteiniphilum sp. TaxID=1926877 RepID=UPI002AB9070B|nr:type IX secretion system outer membrane channel protein PorV [Proteiniphilum sp.]MDY9917769.1 type IX secretion system outer membrane channel protein PorV [Proteiniphilum sp.]
MNKIILTILCCMFWSTAYFSAVAQEYNPIPVALPSLQIAPDARGGGMGDIGAATMPDVYSQHWNAAKYPFISGEAGIAFSYTPWLSKLVSDIHLLYTSGYWKFGNDNLNAISASLRYFSLGEVDIFEHNTDYVMGVSPHEFALDVGYSRKLTETFSGAVTLRYIRADYSTGDDETTPGNAFSADIAGYNESYFYMGRSEALLGLGFNISNIGTKISYDGGNSSMFLPANLRLGASLGYPLDPKNTLSLSFDVNKLLVPTPRLASENESDDEAQRRIEEYQNISSIGGIFKSLGDAPGGFKEEMQEVMWSLGAEYRYDNRFSVRTGYYHESEYKGNRRYFTFGAGFRSDFFQIDAAYLVSTAQSNPLDQTLRVSLGFDVEGIRNLMR